MARPPAPALALALVSALALVAGCINGDPIPARPTPEPMPAPTPAASKSIAPTNATPSSPTVPLDATNASAPNATARQVPYAWESSLPAQACRPDPVGSGCAGALPAEGGSDTPDLEGNATHATLELTWTPAAPGGIERMTFSLLRGGVVVATIAGPSPLALDADVPSGTDPLVVTVSAASMTPGPVTGYAHAEQPFSVSGEFTVVANG